MYTGSGLLSMCITQHCQSVMGYYNRMPLWNGCNSGGGCVVVFNLLWLLAYTSYLHVFSGTVATIVGDQG